MLCPDCNCAAPGGTPCPLCGRQAPERESFGGQGGHYLRILVAASLVLLIAPFAPGIKEAGLQAVFQHIHNSGWLWLHLTIALIPTGLGIYYWTLLREEEITVTDEYISRLSHWGNERLAWSNVREFRCKPILFRRTRLGRIGGLSRLFVKRGDASPRTERIGEQSPHQEMQTWSFPPTCYELIGSVKGGVPVSMRLEPGTISDLPWLLKLVEERMSAHNVPLSVKDKAL